ncbi:MAG: LytR C-terminal domain-containing protein [Desulfobacterales bacterium]|nr:LytR C-terminal domain-containing protein [Desulfobacterales bacterium]MDD4391132.1 LytR C-terminal domain-containing protein [Desulfobacterales bacterium]
MKKTSETHISLWLILTGCFMLLPAIGCSGGFQLSEWMPFRNSGVVRYKVPDQDIRGFTSTIRPWQGDTDALYRQAIHLQKRNLHLAAIEDFKRLLTVDPASVNALNGMGISYDCIGDLASAIQVYENALKINPDPDYIHNNLGYARLLSGDLNGSIDAFREAIRIAPHNPKYHNNLAVAYAENRQFDLAFEEFRKNMDQTRAAHNLARILYRNGWAAEADYYSRFTGAAGKAADNKTTPIRETGPLYASKSHLIDPPHPGILPPVDTMDTHPVTQTTDNMSVSAESIHDQTAVNVSFALADTPQKNVSDKSCTENSDDMNTTPYTVGKPSEHLLTVGDKEEPAGLPDLGIEVSNGNGVNRMATRVGRHLKNKGFHVTAVNNAIHFNHFHTMIYYSRGLLHEAYEVAKQIPGYQNMEKVDEFEKPEIRIRVLLGKDLSGWKRVMPLPDPQNI